MFATWRQARGWAVVAALAVTGVVLARTATTAPSGAGALSGKTDRPNILVYVEGLPALAADPNAAHGRIAQRELAFSPEVTITLRGTTIDFPNDDKVFHNVFSLSEPARFDLGLYKSGDSKSVTFNHAGVVDVYCNIHPQMAAKVKVLDTRYFAVSGADGTFLIPNVPAGTYSVVAWQPYGDPARASATVEPGRSTSLVFTLPPAQGRTHHVRKDGTPYGRYQ